MRLQARPPPAFSFVPAVLLGLLLQPSPARAISSSQIDDFSDGSTQGWAMGVDSITASHMTNISDGGPTGTGDSYLQIVADGTAVQGGRLTFFNQMQWTGNYLESAVTAIALDVRNLSSSEPLDLRLAIRGGFLDPDQPGVFLGGLFATDSSVSLNSGSDWTHAVFSLAPGNLVPVSGRSGTTGNDVMVALGNVLELRLLNSATPDWNGLPVTATLGIDNVRAVSLPSTAALLVSGLLVLLSWRRSHR